MKKILVGILLLSLWLQPVLPFLEIAYAQNPNPSRQNPSPTLPLTHHGGQAGQGDTGQDQQKTVKTIQPSSTSLFSDPLDYVKGYRQKVAQQNFKAYFKEKKSETDYLSYRYGDNWLNLSPTFSKTFTVNYETSENQIKEKIVVSNPSLTLPLTGQGNTSFTSTFTKNSDLKVKVEGKVWDETTAIATSKRIEFIDKDNKTLFYWEPLVYYDSSPTAESVVGKTQLNKSKSGNGFLVTLYVPTSWLSDTSRVYPLIIDPTFTDANSKTLDTQSNWWNSAYALNKQLTVINNGTTGLGSGTVVTQTIDTKALYDAGNLQNDCDDLRITYGTTTQTELTRALVFPAGLSCSTSTATQVSFALQAAISSGSSDANYYMYYKNPAAAGPTNTQQAYNIGSTQATLVLPFNGTTTAVGTGVTPTTATGAIRYSTNSAMSFDGNDDYVQISDQSYLRTTTQSFSLWFKSSKKPTVFGGLVSHVSMVDGYNILQTSGGSVAASRRITGGTGWRTASSSAITDNNWHHIVAVYNNTTISLYVDGVLQATETYDTPTVFTNTNYVLGKYGTSQYAYNGLLDEVAIYNKALSSAEITSLYNSGAGRVVQRDANTKLLLHFDENGSDPRSANTAFDDSGNGNNGTIYGGAKYVSSLVGIDPSTTLGVTSGSFASHQGVFIEEGTVNRIKNPSFESNVTDSWVAKPSINFTTSQTDSDGNALVGSNTIKDVFFYDTTKDSDGGAWRNNATAQASSWYNEAFSTTRGKKKEFPEKAYLVVTDQGLDVIDAIENKLWMRFTNGGSILASTNAIGSSVATGTSVYALNGNIYLGKKYTGADGWDVLYELKIKSDSALYYHVTAGNSANYSSNISNRNAGSGFTNDATLPVLVARDVNDVSIAVISGKTYVAVATDGGVSVINETDGTVVNFNDTLRTTYNYSNAVAFDNSGNLYFTFDAYHGTSGSYYLWVIPKSDANWSSGISNLFSQYPTYDYTNPNGGTNGSGRPLFMGAILRGGIFITNGTSAVDGTSNTIYLATNYGLSVIQEKKGDETHGSVKYYDKNHITEEMVGAIKGQWGLWETTSTEANQFKASGYLDTGKLGQAVSMYGNAAGTTGSTLTFNRGAQISGNNYEHINTNQGTISFWFKPSWNGNPPSQIYLYDSLGGPRLLISNSAIYSYYWDGVGDRSASITGVTWSSSTWYHVVTEWSTINPVSGSQYITITLNGAASTNGYSSAIASVTPGKNFYIGSYSSKNNQAQSLIDDFAIFDRVLTTTEITSLYNTGTGNEAGYVADSSLKFYAKLDGSGTLQPVTYNGGASASKMTRTSSELTGGTNLITNGNLELASSGAPTSWSNTTTPATLADAETANIYADSRSQKISVTGTNQGIYQDIAVSAGTNYQFSGWVKADGTHAGGFSLYDSSNGSYITNTSGTSWYSNSTSWTNITEKFKVPAGCSVIRVYARSVNSGSYDIYIDNLTMNPNLVDNGGMEGTYVGGIAPGFVIYSSPTLTDETTIVHSGGHSQKIATSGSGQGIWTSSNTIASANNWFLVSYWAYGVSGSINVTDNNGVYHQVVTPPAGVWTHYSFINKWAAASGFIFYGAASGATFYLDDISITPLDSVALSLKAWAPVTDSSAIGSSLSVQGNATGVQSLAAGVRNSAYTFDGSTGYLRQQTIATNIGTLSYVGNDTTTASFTDDGATMSTYQASAPYTYMIVVTNSDNTTSWGYMGAASSGNITIFTTKTGTTRGWNGTAPVAGSKVPVGYEIRKTDFQITGNISIGAWVKTSSTGNPRIICKNNINVVGGVCLDINGSFARFGTDNVASVGTTTVIDNVWHYIVGTFDSSTGQRNIYVDGSLQTAVSGTNNLDNNVPLMIAGGLNNNSLSNQFSGSIDEPFVTADALTATEILDMYNKGLGALNHATKTDQKLAGTTNTVQAVAASSDGTYIYAGTDTALTVFKNGKSGNYTDSDSAITSFTTATTPALVSNNSVAIDLVGNVTSTTPSLIVGSSANGVSGINLVRGVPALDSSVYRYGSKALLLDNTNSVLDTPLVMQDTQTSAPYTLSFYAYSTGVTLSNADVVPIGLNAPITTATYEDAGGGWTRVSATYNSDTGTSRSYGIQVKARKKIYIDGVQLEQKSYPTSYADGSLGTGYSWTTANNSATTRSNALLKYSNSGTISTSNGSASIWFKPNGWSGNNCTSHEHDLMVFAISGGNRFLFLNPNNCSGIYLWSLAEGTLARYTIDSTKVVNGQWHNLVLTWNTSETYIYLNGIAGTKGYGVTATNPITTVAVGSSPDATYYSNTTYSDLRVFDSALNTAQVSDLYNAGLASHSEGTSVAVWQPTKTFESATIDASDITNWNTLSWSQNLPGGVGGNPVRFQFAVKASDSDWTTSDFVGSDCSSSSYWSDNSSPYSVSLSTCPALAPDDSSGKRYARYRIYLATADQTVAPTVSNVTVDYELIKPKAPSNLNGSSTSSTAITWNWTDNSVDEAGFKVLDSDGNVKCSVASSNVTTCVETGLSPNTSYSRKVMAWNSRGDSISSSSISVVTLSTAPTSSNISVNRSTASWYNTPLFVFTNSMGGGWNEVSTLKYVWNQTKNYSWSSGESSWTSGTLSVNATTDSNSYYLHLKGFNSEGAANGSVDLGPYYYQGGSPEAGALTINNGAEYSNKRAVTLGLNGNDSGSGISQMMLSEDSNFSGATWQNYATTTTFTLSTGDGTKTVYAKFRNGAGNESGITSDSIILDATTPTAGELTTPENNSYTNSHRPNFSWKAASDNLSGVDHYLLEISGQGDNEKIETKSTFATLQTDLTEGQKTWTVTVVDKAGNTTSNSRTFYVDFAGPTVSNLSFDNTKIEGKADGYQVSSTIEPTVLGNISDNYAADKVEIAYYLQNFLLGIESSRSLQLVETNNLDSGTSQSGFSFRANQPLSFGKYAVVITGIDKAGNRSEEKTLYLWLLTPVQAKTVVNKNSNVETHDRASLPKNETAPVVISLPNLEKQATLKREKEANELAKFTNSINDTLAFMGGTLNKTTQAISQWTKEQSSSWLAWIMAQNKTINKTIATSSKRAEKEASKSIAEGVTNLISTLTSVSRGYQQLQLSLTAAARQMIAVSPEVVRRVVAAVIVRPFENTNKKLADSAQRINRQVKESQSNSQRQIKNLSVNTLELVMATVNGGQKIVGDGIQLMNKTTKVIGSKLAIPFQLSRTAMNQMGKQISLTWQSRLSQTGKGLETAGHFISDPAIKTGNFALRIVKGVQIFVAYVFGNSDPTQIDHVALAEVGKDYAIVTWETNHYTHNNKVNYGTSTSYGQSAWGENETKKHTVKITNLKPGQKYYFEVMSQNGNYAYDAFYTFETEK